MEQKNSTLLFFQQILKFTVFSPHLKKKPACDACELLFSSICLWHVNSPVWMDRQERYSWNLQTTWVRFFTSPILREFCKAINSMLAGQSVSRKKKSQLQHSELLDSKEILVACWKVNTFICLLKAYLFADGGNRINQTCIQSLHHC